MNVRWFWARFSDSVIRWLRLASCLASLITAGCRDATGPTPCAPRGDGAAWQFLGLDSLFVISVAATSNGVLAGTNGTGVWQTVCAGNGTTWAPRGFNGYRVKAVVPVTVSGRAQLFAAVAHVDSAIKSAVVWQSSDEGRRWMERDGGLAQRVFGAADAMSLLSDPARPGSLVAGLGNAVMTSADNGATWRVVLGDPPQPGPDVESLALSRPGGRMWAAGLGIDGDPFVGYSDDDGATWLDTPVFPGRSDLGEVVTALLGDPADSAHLWAGLPGGVWETHDGGASWTTPLKLTSPGEVTDLLRLGSRIIAVTTELEFVGGVPTRSKLGLYEAINGDAWEHLTVPPTAAGGYAAVAIGDSALVIGTRAGVWRARLP